MPPGTERNEVIQRCRYWNYMHFTRDFMRLNAARKPRASVLKARHQLAPRIVCSWKLRTAVTIVLAINTHVPTQLMLTVVGARKNITYELRSPCGEVQTPIPCRILAKMVRESSRQWQNLRGAARSIHSPFRISIIILIGEWLLRATPATSALFLRLHTRSALITPNAK